MMKSDVNSAANPEAGAALINKDSFRQAFEAGAETRYLVAKELAELLYQAFSSLASPPTIKVRTKRFESYYKKYLSALKSGVTNPRITDLIGVRIVCPFIEDLSLAENLIKKHFEVVEVDRKGHYTFKEFGYESTHILIKIPRNIVKKHDDIDCEVAEIQIRTILQDAWAEVEHELFYKAEFNPFDTPMKRKLAAVNASLSLADIVFQEIRFYQKQLNSQLGRRRETFYRKIEESDAQLLSGTPAKKPLHGSPPQLDPDNNSLDDLLLDALRAHNEDRFSDAITAYTRILELNPEQQICALIYKHRGMVNFAQSKYKDAISDFTNAINMADSESYKVAYYRGIVHSVLKKYQKAIDDFSLSLGINPYQAFCLFRRGQAYYHIGDHPHALADCEASLSMEPQNETFQRFRDLLQNHLKM